MKSVIEINNLKKYFSKTKAIDGIDFKINQGEIFGFLGPNGAGKTTTIRCMMDFIQPTSGQITILDQDAHLDSVALKSKIGYLPTENQLYDYWTGKDHIDLLTRIHQKSLDAHNLREKLDFNPNLKVRHLSTGNKKKLALILALVHKPKILILDEPTAGLDPLLQNVFFQILADLKKDGVTIFMSSHNLHEVEENCDRVGIIKNGKMVTIESISQIRQKRLIQVTVIFKEKIDSQRFRKLSDLEIKHVFDKKITAHIKGDINPFLKELAKTPVEDLQIKSADLDEIFMEYYI